MTDVRTLPVTVLDEQTKDELQPPCESVDVRGRPICSVPAEWVMVCRCAKCGPRPMRLRCARCLSDFLNGCTATCLSCGHKQRADVLSVVRL